MEYKQFQLTLCFDLHVICLSSTLSPCLKVGIQWDFEFQLIGTLESFTCLKKMVCAQIKRFTIRNLVQSNPHICDLCPNQPFFQILMQLSFVAPWEKQLVIKIIKNWFIVTYPTILVTNVIYMKVMMKSGCIYHLFLMVFQNR